MLKESGPQPEESHVGQEDEYAGLVLDAEDRKDIEAEIRIKREEAARDLAESVTLATELGVTELDRGQADNQQLMHIQNLENRSERLLAEADTLERSLA